MFYTTIFGRSFSIELRNGVGLDLEFVDSRPIYLYNTFTEELIVRPFQGTILLLPLMIISFGRAYEETEE
jgi:hypothetical protein